MSDYQPRPPGGFTIFLAVFFGGLAALLAWSVICYVVFVTLLNRIGNAH